MIELSGDPYEGARQAFLALNRNATDEDWESFLTQSVEEAHGEFDNYKAFARLCREATVSEVEIEPRASRHIAYAAGFFEAMEKVVSSLLGTLPVSSCVPHHHDRVRRGLIDPRAQFE